MRKLLLVVLVSLPLAALGETTQTVVLDVRNITCELCPITVKTALRKVPGIADTRIDMATKTATVKFDPGRTKVAALVKATADAGFPSAPHR